MQSCFGFRIDCSVRNILFGNDYKSNKSFGETARVKWSGEGQCHLTLVVYMAGEGRGGAQT